MKNFTFIKNIKGGLTINLSSYDMMLPNRNFTIPYNIEKVSIPEQYALGLFVSESALQQFKDGYFTIEHFEELEQMAQTIGLFSEIEQAKILSKDEIATCLAEKDVEKVDEIIARCNYIEMTNLVVCAREIIDSLPKNIIDKIGNACGVDLEIE